MCSQTNLRLRILSADFYSAVPSSQFDETYNHFRSSVIKQLPIIRVFGITPTGDKACVHIHGVFPYIYVPFPSFTSKGHSLHYEVANSLDEALNNALNSKRQHVFKVSTISSKPFYGYHSKEVDFLKIWFYHPSSIKQGVNLLQSGAVCNQSLQPHEAHIPYILQFFMDYNLYGMNFLNLSDCTNRCETSSRNTPENVTFLRKMTNCSVEVDTTASNIIIHLGNSSGLNPGLANIRKEEEKRHEEDGVQLEEFTPENSREYIPTASDIRFREALALALQKRSLMENVTETTIRSQASMSSQLGPVTFDHEDMSILRVILGRVVGENIPDDDSVLGFTPDQDNIEDLDQDLSQPYVSFIIDSDEELPENQENFSDTVLWPELDGFSQINENEGPEPPYVDGNMDEERTPEKNSSKSKNEESPRYKPLEIKLSKSPRRKISKKKQATSPKMFKKLEEKAASLRNITSPNQKVTGGCRNLPSTSMKEPDIIVDSDNSDHKDSQWKLKFSLSDNSLQIHPERVKKNMKHKAKKVLFKTDLEETENKLPETNSISNILNTTEEFITESKEDVSNHTPTEMHPKVIEKMKNSDELEGMPEVSTPMSNISLGFGNSEELDLNVTNYSQCTITSFYGDTTIAPSQMDFNMIMTPALSPPSYEEISENLHLFGFEKEPTVTPYYSNPNDSSSSKEVGINFISLKSKYPGCLEEFKCDFFYSSWPSFQPSKRIVILEPAIDPPTSSSVTKELEMLDKTTNNQTFSAGITQYDSQQFSDETKATTKLNKKKPKISEITRKMRNSVEIDQATPNNSGVFKLDFQNLQDAQTHTLHRYTTLMVLELHINTRGDLCPDPAYDEIEAIFYVISNDIPETTDGPCSRITGIIMNCPDDNTKEYPFNSSIVKVASEIELFSSLVELVDKHNPDIISGYEIEMLSWGYLIERAYTLSINLLGQLSRVKLDSSGNEVPTEKFTNKDYDLRIPGRIVLNVWRLMRHEVSLLSYSFENVAYHVLHTRLPKFSFKTLTYWWRHFSKFYKYLVLKYYLTMVDGIEKILDQLNFIGRTSELASLFGIQFYEVLSRGSQFRVESMMLRYAKKLGFIPVSPNVEQRAHMRAPEFLPLIMEPESRFYPDPVIILDFQSLYPSMMIAYNYCFSTCLGRVSNLAEAPEFKFGCTNLEISLKELLKLQKNIHISPAGIAFVDKSIRRGVLPQMLTEILQTRLMVKASMKRHKSNKLLCRVLDARQLGLKLIANVTYGYTSANFSGRMPCVEVADSVVSKGRETLERAIQLVENEPQWRARVVYGDTDSMFVLCPGRNKEEAFVIGQQIADRVTADNPPPVKLKLEKVYQPCILQTKKRYVGFMYESADQQTPVYDAKGIETVRRDGCPAASKVLEKSLKLLFDTNDMSHVKAYVKRQMIKVLSGRLSPAELAFAKEYRGLSGYQPNAPVPALKISKDLLRRDKRAEPRVSERVPYIVVAGPPGLPLISLVRSLTDFLSNPSYVVNADYYISKAILPPLARCFCLLGVDVFSWYSDLPKKQLFNLQQIPTGKRKATIAQYFKTVQCLACGSLTPQSLCDKCQLNPSNALTLIFQTINKLEKKHYIFQKICESCCSRTYETDCASLDCPVFYRRLQAGNDRTHTSILYNTVNELTQF